MLEEWRALFCSWLKAESQNWRKSLFILKSRFWTKIQHLQYLQSQPNKTNNLFKNCYFSFLYFNLKGTEDYHCAFTNCTIIKIDCLILFYLTTTEILQVGYLNTFRMKKLYSLNKNDYPNWIRNYKILVYPPDKCSSKLKHTNVLTIAFKSSRRFTLNSHFKIIYA